MDGKNLYRIGVTPDCPVHQITIGGQNFTRRSEVVTGFGADTKRREIQGSIVRLDEGDIGKIRKNAATKIIRSTHGKKAVARVHSTESATYTERTGDQAVAQFVYVHPEDVDPTQQNSYATLGKPEESAPTPKARRR